MGLGFLGSLDLAHARQGCLPAKIKHKADGASIGLLCGGQGGQVWFGRVMVMVRERVWVAVADKSLNKVSARGRKCVRV